MEDTQTKAALGSRPLRQLDALGGKAGMQKYVQSKGEYNPSDELETSLQEYYERSVSHREVQRLDTQFRI